MSFRRNDRRHFTKKVKLIALQMALGRCEGCTAPLSVGHYTFDHKIPWELTRDSRVENCQILCDNCNDTKTGLRDIPLIAKANRQRDKHRGIVERSRTPLPCGRKSRMKKTIAGRVIPRVSGRQKLRAYLQERGAVFEED